MRTSSERLAEINKRADARIAAIQKRNRTIAGACTTLAMCLVIGLGIHRLLSVSDTPPLVPPEQTTIRTTSTATHPKNTALSAVTPTSTDSTTSSLPSVTDDTIYVTVTTTESIASSTTITMPTTRTTSRNISHTVPTDTTTAHTSTSSAKATATSAPSTTLTINTPTLPTETTQTPTIPPTTSTTDPYGDGNIQSPPYDDMTTTVADSTTTTGDWGFQGGATNPPPTTTTTAAPAGNVVFSVSSFENVAVGDEITVEVKVSDYHYIVAGELYIQYDPDVLQLQSEVFDASPDVLNGAYALSVRCPAEGDMELQFSTSATVGSAKGGTLLRLTFKVRKGFHDSTKIICEVPQMISDSGSGHYDTPVTVINGTIAPAEEAGYDIWV